MLKPVRLQLRRTKGFNLQALSRATNGLEAVRVARPGAWGNPFRINDPDSVGPTITREKAVAYYREYIENCLTGPGAGNTRAALDETLRWKNLACWCPPNAPCHADVLLEFANR
ncbi:MAG TPA: DUF4326 domain-containing protein [Rhizomicrobium sp.]|jgi:hypothetical protein|nr:DUF4326 domain-containing protein [Rhizomicrobium sp.]